MRQLLVFMWNIITLRFTCESKICSTIKKSQKKLWAWLSAKFCFAFLSFLTALIVENSHILAKIFFIFLKNVLDHTWKAFNTKFGRQWKDREKAIFIYFNFRLGSSNKSNLKGSGANYKQEAVFRDNPSQSIWDKRFRVKLWSAGMVREICGSAVGIFISGEEWALCNNSVGSDISELPKKFSCSATRK